VFRELSEIGADARRGELLMIAGQPTAGKSSVALWMALQWVLQHGLRGIYWSADAVAKPAASRVLSMVTGSSTVQTEADLDNGDQAMLDTLDDLTRKGFMWAFDASITPQSLELNVDAFEELWGVNPDWIVIDNLTDVDTRDGDEFSALRAMMRDLNHMVRELNAAGIVLHHVSEDAPENPVPARRFIHGKVSVKPTVVIGTARTTGGSKKPLGALKNRYGAEDKRGKQATWVPFNPLTLQFDETEMG
jgi:replicative DNA helicase